MDKLPKDYIKKQKPTLRHEIGDLKKLLERQNAQQELMIAQLDGLFKIAEAQARTVSTGIFSISIMMSMLFVAHTLWG